jgi:hypothetical protein
MEEDVYMMLSLPALSNHALPLLQAVTMAHKLISIPQEVKLIRAQ